MEPAGTATSVLAAALETIFPRNWLAPNRSEMAHKRGADALSLVVVDHDEEPNGGCEPRTTFTRARS
jgi:hypothetical protein